MRDRPKFFDDLAGMAGGAMSAMSGLREEAEAMVRAQIDEAVRRLQLVKRDEMEAALEMAAAAREAQHTAEVAHALLLDRLAALEHRVAALESPALSGGEPGMIA